MNWDYSSLMQERSEICQAIDFLRAKRTNRYLTCEPTKDKIRIEELRNELREIDETIRVRFPEKVISL